MATYGRDSTKYTYENLGGRSVRNSVDIKRGTISVPVDHRRPLPYFRERRRQITSNHKGSYNYGFTIDGPLLDFVNNAPYASVTTKARAKFADKVKNGVDLGETIAQFGESVVMIANRAHKLLRGWRHLTHGDLRQFFREFDIPARYRYYDGRRRRWSRKPRYSWRTHPRYAGRIWLEYWFGWAPLVSDVYGAVQVLSSEPPSRVIQAFTASNYALSRKDSYYDWNITGRVYCRVTGSVRVVNHSAFLSERLGIKNPLLIAWNLIPFSWVADWFGTIGDFLASFTDLAGIRVTDHSYSQGVMGSGTFLTHNAKWTSLHQGVWDAFRTQRFTGVLPPSTVSFPLLDRLSLTRAATAVSLLTQSLRAR